MLSFSKKYKNTKNEKLQNIRIKGPKVQIETK